MKLDVKCNPTNMWLYSLQIIFKNGRPNRNKYMDDSGCNITKCEEGQKLIKIERNNKAKTEIQASQATPSLQIQHKIQRTSFNTTHIDSLWDKSGSEAGNQCYQQRRS